MKKMLLIPTFFCCIFFLPKTARADGIALEVVLLAGLCFLIPLTLFLVFVEGPILSRRMSIGFRKALYVAFVANMFSLLAGIPVKVGNMYIYSKLLPHELGPFFAVYPWLIALGTFIYFAVTVGVEYLVIFRRLHSLNRKKLFNTVVIANVATYIVLVPLYYYFAKPNHNVRTFTKDSSWAQKPCTNIIYTDAVTNYLCSMDTDGRNKKVLVPCELYDFLLSQDMKYCLFSGCKDDNLYGYNLVTTEKTLILSNMPHMTLNGVAVNKDLSQVAVFKDYDKRFRLCIFLKAKNKLLETDYFTKEWHRNPVVAWSREDNSLYIKDDDEIFNLSFDEKGKTKSFLVKEFDVQKINVDYGSKGWAGRYGRDYDLQDKFGNREASSYKNLEIHDDKKDIVQIARVELPMGMLGMLLGGGPWFGADASLIHDGKECIFNDPCMKIYLLNIEEKKVGKIADGYLFMIKSEKYTKKPLFLEQKPY